MEKEKITQLTNKECIELIYILKEMRIRTNHYKEEAKSSEEYLAFDIFTDQIEDLIEKIEDIRTEIINKEYYN